MVLVNVQGETNNFLPLKLMLHQWPANQNYVQTQLVTQTQWLLILWVSKWDITTSKLYSGHEGQNMSK
ncbi:unnamed protein product [Allacma fusca]|uniref:Uncharacterized protein n=1 Tax=Allacma fusca TaxID=39272 RepID=A0A8J2JE51_9HEXA|nr:unnamed protein product [Allacma fusca]